MSAERRAGTEDEFRREQARQRTVGSGRRADKTRQDGLEWA